MKPKALIRKRNQIHRQMPVSLKVIRGTVVFVKRSCGQKRCRCQRGLKHASWYLSQSLKAKTRMTYLPKGSVEKVREYTENYRQIKNGMDQLSSINLPLLIPSVAHGQKKKR
jgi:hypothetical protein